MDGAELGSDVVGVSAGLVVDGETATGSGGGEAGLGICAGEAFIELLEGSGESVVGLVSAGPESVSSGSGELDNVKGGVISGDGLEGDVAGLGQKCWGLGKY